MGVLLWGAGRLNSQSKPNGLVGLPRRKADWPPLQCQGKDPSTQRDGGRRTTPSSTSCARLGLQHAHLRAHNPLGQQGEAAGQARVQPRSPRRAARWADSLRRILDGAVLVWRLRSPPALQVQGYFEHAFGAGKLEAISQRMCVPSLAPTLRVNTLRISTQVMTDD